MKQKSIKKNAILNVIRVLLVAVFPLITFPYASRILETENIGAVQFASSLVYFFILFAMLGVNGYAVREGSPLREDRKKISKFASEVFSINVITSLITYIALFLFLLLPTKVSDNSVLVWIFSIQIIFTVIGIDWIYTIYEDYLYITIRSVAIQFISLILMFLFVKSKSDYYIYALITVFANSSVYLFNYFHSKKYIDLKFTLKNNFKKHIKSLLILFSNELAQQIYINSDLVMLGIIATNYHVGLYTVAVKIYFLVKKLLNSFIAVTIPRMAYYSKKSKEKFNQLGSDIFNVSIFLLLPMMVLLFLLSKNLILFISGKEYIGGTLSLQILSIGLIFAVFANIFCNGILIVKKQEKYVLYGTLIAAISNLVLNFIFIPLFKQDGAAITTVISEFIIMTYSFIKAKDYLKIDNFIKNIIKEIIGCIGIVLSYLLLLKLNINSNIIFIIINGMAGLIVYFIIELILKNSIMLEYFDRYLSKLKLSKRTNN